MSFTPDEVRQWMRSGEGRQIEFKRGLPRPERTGRVLCAFANTRGGILLVGVTDRGELWGVPDPDGVAHALREIALHVIEPPLATRIQRVELDGSTLVCCSVPLSPQRPHRVLRSDGVHEVVVRVGSSNRAADGATRRALGQRPTGAPRGDLEQRMLDWVAAQTVRQGANAGVTAADFARAHNVGLQRAQRAFRRLELDGFLVAHGLGTRRRYASS